MKMSSATLLFASASILLPFTALASPIGVDGAYGAEWSGTNPVSIAGGSSNNGNFGSASANGNVAYNIYTRDDGNYFYVLLTTTDAAGGALDFANLYFDTVASTPGTGSNLGFQITNDAAFNPNVNTPTSLAGTGNLFFATDYTRGTYGIEAAIANSFFLNDSLGLGYAPTPNGSLVSLHLSQSFGYGVVGGSGNFAAPAELGDAIVSSPSTAAAPEPGSLALLGTGLLGVVGLIRKKVMA